MALCLACSSAAQDEQCSIDGMCSSEDPISLFRVESIQKFEQLASLPNALAVLTKVIKDHKDISLEHAIHAVHTQYRNSAASEVEIPNICRKLSKDQVEELLYQHLSFRFGGPGGAAPPMPTPRPGNPDPHKGVFDPVTRRFYPAGTQLPSDEEEEVEVDDSTLDSVVTDISNAPSSFLSSGIDEYLENYLRRASAPVDELEDPVYVHRSQIPLPPKKKVKVKKTPKAAPKPQKAKAAPTAQQDYAPPNTDYTGSSRTASGPGAWKPVSRPESVSPKPIAYHLPGENPEQNHFEVLSDWPGPRVYKVSNFLNEKEVEGVLALAQKNLHKFGARSEIGISFEMDSAIDPLMTNIIEREFRLMGIRNNETTHYFRVRRYENNEYHPLHTDTYTFNNNTLVATMLIYLTSPAKGGETFFPRALEDRFSLNENTFNYFPEVDTSKPFDKSVLVIPPKAGDLVIWMSCDVDGQDDPLSMHGSAPLVEGVKWTATNFVYASLSECRFGPGKEVNKMVNERRAKFGLRPHKL